MHIRDRVKELRRVRAAELRPNPLNWRLHPAAQQNALRGVLAEIGYASALLARELDDGSLELIDGHLRAETTPEELVPVLVLDLNDAEARQLLATHDALTGMAEIDLTRLGELAGNVEFESPAVRELLAKLSGLVETPPEETESVAVPEAYQVVVQCDDEAEQRRVYEQLTAEGLKCRLLML